VIIDILMKIMLNEPMELNSRRAPPLDAVCKFRCEFSAQPLVSAAVAHFNRSAGK